MRRLSNWFSFSVSHRSATLPSEKKKKICLVFPIPETEEFETHMFSSCKQACAYKAAKENLIVLQVATKLPFSWLHGTMG